MFFYSPRIVVDPAALAVVASNLKLAHDTLALAPRYTRLDAGDVRGRVPDAVSDFITKNEGPREEIVAQLNAAYRQIEVVASSFADTENCLVRALTGEDT